MKSKIGGLLFAAVFAIAFGVGGYFGGIKPLVGMLHDAWRVQSFVPVNAQLMDVQIKLGSKGTHAVLAKYRYSFNRQEFESSRIGLHSGGADNIGNWHSQWYQRLKQAKDYGTSITVWVDPNEPKTALIDKHIRWPLFWFSIPFALLFPAVGAGALWVMYRIVVLPKGAVLFGRHKAANVMPPQPHLEIKLPENDMGENDFPPTPRAAWSPAGSDDAIEPVAVPPKVMQVVEQQGQWIASFSSSSGRWIGVFVALATGYMAWRARQAFVGDDSVDVLWTIGLLAIAVLGTGACIHFFTVRWHVIIDPRSVRQQTRSWLKTREQVFAHADIAGYGKKLAYRQSQMDSSWKDVFFLYVVLADKRRVKITPGIAHASAADAVADTIRQAKRQYAQRFADQASEARQWQPAACYGLWLLLAMLVVAAVSLNTTYRITDPINPERMLIDWKLRLKRLTPAGRLHNDVLTAQDAADMVSMEALLKKGANPNTVANNGITILMLAARRGSMRNIELLLQYGADVNQRDETSNNNRGDTALLVALHTGREDVMLRLLQAGARLDVSNMWDWTPMHMAAQGNCIACLELLKSKGLDLHAKATASRGETPAMLAAGKGRLEALQWFAQNGVDLKAKDPHGQTALDWAVFFKRSNTEQWLRGQSASDGVIGLPRR